MYHSNVRVNVRLASKYNDLLAATAFCKVTVLCILYVEDQFRDAHFLSWEGGMKKKIESHPETKTKGRVIWLRHNFFPLPAETVFCTLKGQDPLIFE